MRFRKGKKAYKLGRENKLSDRYAFWLLRIESKKKQAVKMAQIAVSVAMSVSRVRVIQQLQAEPHEKALMILGAILDNAKNIQQISKQ